MSVRQIRVKEVVHAKMRLDIFNVFVRLDGEVVNVK